MTSREREASPGAICYDWGIGSAPTILRNAIYDVHVISRLITMVLLLLLLLVLPEMLTVYFSVRHTGTASI